MKSHCHLALFIIASQLSLRSERHLFLGVEHTRKCRYRLHEIQLTVVFKPETTRARHRIHLAYLRAD